MNYDTFKSKVNNLIASAGGGISVRFSTDPDTGRYFAKCSEGTIIMGNHSCLNVFVRWGGRNHQSIASI